ncbi:helix-turn-helix transcriptional regulator [Paenibacillus hemerocallicola]|uniref:Helix-turn-helix transcriptional regulator n=1 Tax=Paenibacillus hemerocallicola TaxID=1172614 RepID=A0A5C4TCD4_9BACL|nr:helix-turn-helix transcriptional regulator [Paenibacillus hemerocallicola]
MAAFHSKMPLFFLTAIRYGKHISVLGGDSSMQSYRPRELTPVVHIVTRWEQKAQFVKERDRCPMWVLFIVAGGSFRFRIGKNEGIAEKGDLVLCPPDTVLYREMLSPATFVVMYFSWYAAGQELASADRLHPSPVGKSTIRDKHRFVSTYGYIAMLARRRTPLIIVRRNFLLQELWEQLEWERERGAQQRAARRAADDPLMSKAESLLKESAFEIVVLSELAARLGLSTVQFSRRFRRKFGVNPSEYVSELRLDKASSLLRETKLTLDEIAPQCGYSNGFYFSRVFSQKMQISPSEYRQAYRM